MSDIIAVRNEYRANEWLTIIQECQNSGLTKKEYCKQKGLSEKALYYWLRKFRTQAIAAAATPQIVPIEIESETEEKIHIQFKGAELTLPVETDIDAVAALLRSIQSL